jgi:hypothetical protein
LFIGHAPVAEVNIWRIVSATASSCCEVDAHHRRDGLAGEVVVGGPEAAAA